MGMNVHIILMFVFIPRYLPDVSASKQHMIDNRLAALLTYPPAFLIPIVCICISKNATLVNIVLVMLMISHYLQR